MVHWYGDGNTTNVLGSACQLQAVLHLGQTSNLPEGLRGSTDLVTSLEVDLT